MSAGRRRDSGPKVFRDNPGAHFDPYYYDKEKNDRILHERGQEKKILYTMGERVKARAQNPDYEVQNASRRPVTLAPLKWGKDP
jgi:hypothetical protein